MAVLKDTNKFIHLRRAAPSHATADGDSSEDALPLLVSNSSEWRRAAASESSAPKVGMVVLPSMVNRLLNDSAANQ